MKPIENILVAATIGATAFTAGVVIPDKTIALEQRLEVEKINNSTIRLVEQFDVDHDIKELKSEQKAYVKEIEDVRGFCDSFKDKLSEVATKQELGNLNGLCGSVITELEGKKAKTENVISKAKGVNVE